ncbi:ComEC/Rec2 family competence protein [Clostridium massiliamazoniense]|uniref:ComEC/Rec2 family competence protein n=1 Tax=Clostridium massiliamazoniense TaxID=1347366 RepID=UPI0006D83991|nr:ComEC/Rec2 family competence protein [Clostridium massiliamazoniense]
MNVPKILINKPILHILMGTIIGIVTYLFWNQNQLSAVVITALFVIYIYFFYELKYFKILLCFFILGYISIFAYFNLVGNKYGFYEARVEEVYSKYSLGTLNGRKVYINSKENNFEKNEVIKFKGKFKRSIDLDKAIVGDLFVYEIIDVKYDWIYKLRSIPKAYNEYLNKYIRKEHSAVITALTFGNKEFLEKEEKEKFKTLGVIHLICISGFHIAIIHQIIKKILNNNIALVVAFSYVILTGMTASAIRAFLMISCLSLSTTVFKKYDNISALGFSALILLIIKPINIVDVGFHLSYLATAGILLLYKFF